MGVQATVVFTDLHGSTAVFEALGNARATESVTQITTWITVQCEIHGGRLVKTLGDGVMVIFGDPAQAVAAVVDIQRLHHKKTVRLQSGLRLPIRIGLASGEIEMVADDCYGDAVNVASRLCDLCGPHQIWASANTLETVQEVRGSSFRMLGPIHIRGRAEPCNVFQIEWREEEPSDFLTMQAQLSPEDLLDFGDALGREVVLQWMDTVKSFKSFELPIHIGRVKSVEFAVNDPRVSRTHARLEWRNGCVMLVDMSSYGSWVRFSEAGGADVLLRREECVLHGKGELALGASFADLSAPTVTFTIK
ncbi:adenylate/guanylate cyclase domain-containing protein [Rhodoferax sp. TH121]|uniref:adenylate/guanylate cyclase domain-containing protein n=1 Tax=Rhodoferax sp. TH121 TaxID=2022803 RepID=UPI000B960825|nr:adenylate/guanylate cyclase domain-containing protein [Rhodoferax sp. TH121]OYQ40408.1 adenylate/guanylate cyclase domain-containing protein [Rhodoferax sp. TH121]